MEALRVTEDFASLMRRVTALTDAGEPLPDALHEKAARAGLALYPDDAPSIRSLIMLLLLSSRPPFPDEDILFSAAAWRAAEAENPGHIDELLQAAEQASAAGEVIEAYAALWQAAVRWPDSPRPWAEYARYLADRSEWSYCRAAVVRALQCPERSDLATTVSLLEGLSALVEEGQLRGIDWRAWMETIPSQAKTHPLAINFLLRAGEREEAKDRLSTASGLHEHDARTWLVASKVAFEENRPQDSYIHLRRAFDLDFPATLHTVVRRWSGPATNVVKTVGQTEQFAQWLEERSRSHEGVTLIPSSPAPEIHAAITRSRNIALERGLPSALLVTQGKSGSVSVGNILASGFGLQTVLYGWIHTCVVERWLQDYLRGGASYVTHLDPTDANIRRLAASGVKNVTIHTRDPRQIAVSTFHHIRNYPKDATREWREELVGNPDKFFDFLILKILPDVIAWTDGWFKARLMLPVHFTTFEEFVTDPDVFCEKIIAIYGGDRKYFDRVAAFGRQRNTDFHLRLGEIDEWRRVLDARQVTRINSMMPDYFWNAFGWNP